MIKIKDSSDGLFYFTVQAPNNEILVTGETLTTKQNTIESAQSLFKTLGEYFKNALRGEIEFSTKKKFTRKDVLKMVEKIELVAPIYDETVRKVHQPEIDNGE